MEEYLKTLYYDSTNSASFGGLYKLYKQAKLKYPDITLEYVKNWLIDQTAYTLHKNARRNFKRNKYYVSFIDELWQADLIDMQQFSRQNSGFKYILTVIDCFSKFLFAFPIKTKKTLEIIEVFKSIFEKRKPMKLMTDRGGEFDSIQFKTFCKNNDVNYYTTKDKLIKCAIVERANRTLKEKLFRYFTFKGTRKYIDVIKNFVDSYNKSKHSTTKIAPIEVTENNEKHVFKDVFGVKNLKHLFFGRKSEPKLKIQDKVRIKYDLTKLDKSYYPLWSDKVYEIKNVLNKYTKPQYVVNLENIEQFRRFYPEELQKISNKPTYRIEKIIKKKRINGEVFVLVKWLNYNSRHNQWIPETEVKRLK
jgi:hypothetical protein